MNIIGYSQTGVNQRFRVSRLGGSAVVENHGLEYGCNESKPTLRWSRPMESIARAHPGLFEFSRSFGSVFVPIRRAGRIRWLVYPIMVDPSTNEVTHIVVQKG